MLTQFPRFGSLEPTSICHKEQHMKAILASIVCCTLLAATATAADSPSNPSAKAAASGLKLPIAPGPFQPESDSFKQYRCPEWFRDAKLGIWAHWGPQAVPMSGDWYARHMYVQGHPQYKHYLGTAKRGRESFSAKHPTRWRDV
jgi:hypothetical protein